MFTFLINTADKEIYNIFNSFLFPYYFNTNRTNKHTHINRVLIIKIEEFIVNISTGDKVQLSNDITKNAVHDTNIFLNEWNKENPMFIKVQTDILFPSLSQKDLLIHQINI